MSLLIKKLFAILLVKGGNILNQIKIGAFLKELRKEKGLTQEQFSEIVNVSNRTVSRWENGNNLPDLDILIQIADYYEVELREILNGERKSKEMEKDLEEIALKSADYTNMSIEKYNNKIHFLLIIGAVCWLISSIINHTEFNQIYILKLISGFTNGVNIGMLFGGIILTSRYGNKIKAFKQRLIKKF